MSRQAKERLLGSSPPAHEFAEQLRDPWRVSRTTASAMNRLSVRSAATPAQPLRAIQELLMLAGLLVALACFCASCFHRQALGAHTAECLFLGRQPSCCSIAGPSAL